MFISVDLPAPFSPRRACTSPAAELEVDVVVRDDARERLRDPAHLEHNLRARRTHSWGAILNARKRARGGLSARPSAHTISSATTRPSTGSLSLPAMIRALYLLASALSAAVTAGFDLAERDAAVLQVEDQVRPALELARLLTAWIAW